MDDRTTALKSVPLFGGLSDKDLRHVLEVTKEVRFDDGRKVVEEDAQAVGFHLILEGNAIINVHGQDVSTFGPGDYFGEMSIIDGGARSAQVTAETDLTCYGMTAWNFRPFLKDHPDLVWALLQTLVARLREVERRQG